MRARDLGVNDTQVCILNAIYLSILLIFVLQYLVRTHLGHILSAGDNAWGYDFVNGNLNDDNANKLKDSDLPEVVSLTSNCSDGRHVFLAIDACKEKLYRSLASPSKKVETKNND